MEKIQSENTSKMNEIQRTMAQMTAFFAQMTARGSSETPSSIILEIMVSVQVTTPFHYTAFKISPTHRLLSEFSFVLSLIEQASLIVFAL